MRAHILILNFNGAGLLKRYLPSFIRAVQNSRRPCRVSVVDNQSADESEHVSRSFGPVLGWIPMRENRVLCAYNDAARALQDDILIFMNNDIEPHPDFVDPLLEPFEKDAAVFFVTPRCLGRDGRTYEGNRTRGGIRYGVFWATALYPGYEKEMDQPGPTLQGGFGAFNRRKFLSLGGYDDLYLPGRLEDADLCFRAYQRGWKCLYEPRSVVVHEGGTTFHRVFGKNRTLVINWRNTFLFMLKNLSDKVIFLQFILWLPVRAVVSLLRLRPEFLLGLGEALVRLPGALRRRRALKKSGFRSVAPDRVIFNRLSRAAAS